MKLIRHILSHLLLITVIFGLVSVFYYRHYIFPDSYSQTMDGYAEKIHPKLKLFARNKVLPEDTKLASSGSPEIHPPVVSVTETVKPEIREVSTEIQVPEKNIIPEKTAISEQGVMPEKNIIPEQTVMPEQTAIAENNVEEKQPAAGEPPNTDIAMTDVPVAEENKAEEKKLLPPIAGNISENSSVKEDAISITASSDNPHPEVSASESTDDEITTDKEAASANSLLRTARQAFQQGKLDIAIEKYNELVELENDEADFYGELGNVYYAMGQWNKAGIAYYEAATRLIEGNNFSQVVYLQRVIQGLDSGRAEKLAEQLAVLSR
ncbi:hypothetical protein MNBD_GAMMA23-1137 [hydrothermal vent metagenome]|uniref:Uncharacterized protein n=1 Tax=hydrothermal vent metagenome TaxID=652676 RepID=A0A3B0ZQ49_9ZZZZ